METLRQDNDVLSHQFCGQREREKERNREWERERDGERGRERESGRETGVSEKRERESQRVRRI